MLLNLKPDWKKDVLNRSAVSSENQQEHLDTGQTMEESDDDFKELCSSYFQRVKKSGPKELSRDRKKPKASSSTQIRNKLKKPRQTASKSKTLPGSTEKKSRVGRQASRAANRGAAKSQEQEPITPTENGADHVLPPAQVPAVDLPALGDGVQNPQTGAPIGDVQSPASGPIPVVPSPSKPRTTELVLQRMQRFKRADPTRLRHTSGTCSFEAATAENTPEDPQEETVVGNGYEPTPPATESDMAVALALQQELGQEAAPAHADDLEEKGWFFCQICQKDLSTMNVTRREQHMNRCLDEAEKALRPSAPQVPECPICGRLFLTFKSRSSHLKQCAVKMEVCPQLLLQAVRQQTAQLEGDCSPTTPSFSHQVGSLKRKGAPNKKEPPKRRKINQPEAPSEDLLMAMALSRSEVEQSGPEPTLKLESAFSKWFKPGADKKSRRKQLTSSLPPLLLQDSEAAQQHTEKRVAMLFAEEVVISSTPPLPKSGLLKKESEKAGWRLQLAEGRQKFLWEGSALAGSWTLEAFYTTNLVPPIVPRQPVQGLKKEPTSPVMQPDQLKLDASPPLIPCGPRVDSVEPVGQKASPSSSQKERQALQDLMDLAGEGLGPSSGGLADWGGEAAVDLVPSSLPLSGFVLPPQEEHLERGSRTSLYLGLLLSDFGAMVNNPHLSDVQFQVDSGEVLYAHKFVLYARCPLLIQHVNREGFVAIEDGDLRTQRVLLSDVSTEAARAFLHYLYTADTGLSFSLAPDLHSLALRFGVSELAHVCEQAPLETDAHSAPWKKEEEDCVSRADNFQEVLRSMWLDEEGDAEALAKPEGHGEDREKVDEVEMEEIYEFAATQRKLLQEERTATRDEAADQLREECPAPACVLAQGQLEDAGHKESSGQGSDPSLAAPVSSRGQRPHGEEDSGPPEQEAMWKAPGQCSSSSPPGRFRAGRRGRSVLYTFEDSEQFFSATQGEYSEPTQITGKQEDHKGVSCSPRCQQAPAVQQPTWGVSPPRPHPRPHHAGESSLLTPRSRSQTVTSRVVSWDSPVVASKQRRDSGVPAFLPDPGHQGGRGSMGASPGKSSSIDLTQSDSAPSSSSPAHASSAVSRDTDVILLLDSDEELELKQTRARPVPSDLVEEKKVLEVSPRSSELFSVIDIDADLECSPSLPGREAELQQGAGELPGNRGHVGDRGRRGLFHPGESSPEEDSATDMSWLVPATPLVHGSHLYCPQPQASSVGSRTSVHKAVHLEPRTPCASRDADEATDTFPVLVPRMVPPQLVTASPGNSEGRRRAPRNPYGQQPRHHLSPVAPCPPRRCSPPRPLWLSQATSSEVVEVEDSDDEPGVAPHQANSSPLLDREPPIPVDDCCWSAEPLSPIPIDHLNMERTGPLSTSSPSTRAREASGHLACDSPGPLDTTPIRRNCPNLGGIQEQSPLASSPGGSKLSYLNSALWDDWDGEEKSPELLPLTQRRSANRAGRPGGSETPKGTHRKKNLPPKVPITPMPRYSIMETPVLKKELDRFGVRPLPKRQMVLKLKEIFQYTHQTLESDSEDEIPSSQVPPTHTFSAATTTEATKTSRAGGHLLPEDTAGPNLQKPTGPTEIKSPRRRRKQPGKTPPALHTPPGSDGDGQLPASQESAASSVTSSDGSWGSQSSSTGEFGVAFESEGADEGEEGVTASQAATRTADTEAAVWRYIRSQPALYLKVLRYQPLELAALQAELRQNGIRLATGKLLDFLDAQCITFTTAAARKERLQRKRGRRPAGRKKRGQD
ncbi:PREDICTED: structure-specific endonuclease subunit SLX4 [Chrysochloris asiatica]|uniref:Structure-specific endonuclease subunit SLX4 n=1 Tax=Chrysochloris asiatica TaxID=185453 RepID=A0A9B0X1J5_CHRAS|nr:PREDICTED: structure-specific endonuclease subunit SLX4 [Chrysochloris asiatica]